MSVHVRLPTPSVPLRMRGKSEASMRQSKRLTLAQSGRRCVGLLRRRQRSQREMGLGVRMRKSPHQRPRPLFHALSVGQLTAHTIWKITSCTKQRLQTYQVQSSRASLPLLHFTTLICIRAGYTHEIFFSRRNQPHSLSSSSASITFIALPCAAGCVSAAVG